MRLRSLASSSSGGLRRLAVTVVRVRRATIGQSDSRKSSMDGPTAPSAATGPFLPRCASNSTKRWSAPSSASSIVAARDALTSVSPSLMRPVWYSSSELRDARRRSPSDYLTHGSEFDRRVAYDLLGDHVDCGMVFSSPVPPAWIVDIETLTI